MEAMKQVYLLLICQGFYLGSGGQEWTFPNALSGLIGSCVEIPCTYDPAGISGTSSPVWYKYKFQVFLEILNTKNLSLVLEEYKNRTSLVPGNNSCTLRIDPVRREDAGTYYPGIAEDRDINADDKQFTTVHFEVIDPTDKLNIQLHGSDYMIEGEATTIRCTIVYACRSSPPSLQWNKPGRVTNQSVEISDGYWREESVLTFTPSYEDHESLLQCTATFHNNICKNISKTLYIFYPPRNVTVTLVGKHEVIEGSQVTLQCNSFAKPEAHDYEWYQGKTKLPRRGQELAVRDVTRDMETYSCVARNALGRGESAPIKIPVVYEDSRIVTIITATIGAMICLLLLVLVVFFCWRKRCKKVTSNEPVDATHIVSTRDNKEAVDEHGNEK